MPLLGNLDDSRCDKFVCNHILDKHVINNIWVDLRMTNQTFLSYLLIKYKAIHKAKN